MERQKRTSLAFTIVLFSISCAGCFVPIIDFDPPPFLPVESNALPKRVDKAFSKAYPTRSLTTLATKELSGLPVYKFYLPISHHLVDGIADFVDRDIFHRQVGGFFSIAI